MGKNNRNRRGARQRQRHGVAGQREHVREDKGPDRAQLLERLVVALSAAAGQPSPLQAAELLQGYRGFERELGIAADVVVREAMGAAWARGWTPTDLHEIAKRRVDTAAARYLDEAIVLDGQRHSPAAVHPRWRAELAELAATTGPLASGPQMWRWAATHSADERTVLTLVLQVCGLLARLPVIEVLLPLPGEYRESAPAVGEVDEKMLARVRALLAKAESTEFPEEAEALSDKAQALMVRYSLQEAVASHDSGRAPVATARRIWIDNPYVAAKVALVQAVAQANRCRVVWMKNLGCVVIVGASTDLDLVELLTTSLLVQASRAMLVAGRRYEVRGQSRTKSFRHSFLVAYAGRIGERLTATSSSVTEELVRDQRLLPVLAARNRAADDAFQRLFPRTVVSPLAAAYDTQGLGAGRAAADAAVLDVRKPIAG